MFANRPVPQMGRANEQRVKMLWAAFAKSLAVPRAEMERRRDEKLTEEDKKWQRTPARARRSPAEHAKTKATLRREIEETHYTFAREQWQKKLAEANLRDDDWTEMTPAETRAVEDALGAHLVDADYEEPVIVHNVSPPIPSYSTAPPPPVQAPPPPPPPVSLSSSRSSNLSSNYAFVNPKDFGSDDDDPLFQVPKQRLSNSLISEDEDLGIPRKAGWATESSGYNTTWSTDSLGSAQSSQTGSPEPSPHMSLYTHHSLINSRTSMPAPAPPKGLPDANDKGKARLPGPSYLGPHLSDPDEPIDEEADFERFKMDVRVQKIIEFHQAAARADIELALAISDARKSKVSTKGEDHAKVREHELRMRDLQEAKETERKEIVSNERKLRREKLKRGATLRDPARAANTNQESWWRAVQDDSQIHLDLGKDFDLARMLQPKVEPQHQHQHAPMREAENVYGQMYQQPSSFPMFESTLLGADQHSFGQGMHPHPSMHKRTSSFDPGSKPSLQTQNSQIRASMFAPPVEDDESDEEDDEEDEEEGEDGEAAQTKAMMEAFLKGQEYNESQWTPKPFEDPSEEPRPMWGVKPVSTPVPVAAPVAATSGWAKKLSPPIASGWGKKPTPSILESQGRDTPTSQIKMASPFGASKLKGKFQVDEPAAPVFPTSLKSTPTPSGLLKKMSPPVPEKSVLAKSILLTKEKAAPTPPPPAPVASASKKQNKKGGKLTKKGGKAEPEPAPVEEEPPKIEEDEEEEMSYPDLLSYNKQQEFASTPRPMSKNPFQADSPTVPSFKWDDGPTTPRQANVRRLAQETVRPSMLRQELRFPESNQDASSSSMASNVEQAGNEFWMPGGTRSLWDMARNGETPAPQIPQPPSRANNHEYWVPGGSSAASSKPVWGAPSTSHATPQIEKSQSMPTQRVSVLGNDRLRRISEPAAPTPPAASILKKAKAKKGAKANVIVEEVSDEEGAAGPKDWSQKLPSDSRIILEPRPSAPPTAFHGIFGYEGGEGGEEEEEEEEEEELDPWSLASSHSKLSSSPPDAAELYNDAWYQAAARELQQGTLERERSLGGAGVDMSTIRANKQVRWTPSVSGGDTPSIFSGSEASLPLPRVDPFKQPPKSTAPVVSTTAPPPPPPAAAPPAKNSAPSQQVNETKGVKDTEETKAAKDTKAESAWEAPKQNAKAGGKGKGKKGKR